MTHKDEKKELSSNFECAVILCHKVYGLVVMYISSLCSRLRSSAHNQSANDSGSIESEKIIETSNPIHAPLSGERFIVIRLIFKPKIH